MVVCSLTELLPVEVDDIKVKISALWLKFWVSPGNGTLVLLHPPTTYQLAHQHISIMELCQHSNYQLHDFRLLKMLFMW